MLLPSGSTSNVPKDQEVKVKYRSRSAYERVCGEKDYYFFHTFSFPGSAGNEKLDNN